MCTTTTLLVRVVYHETLSCTLRRMTLSPQRGFSIEKIGIVPAIEIGMGIGEAVGMELPRENGTAIGEVKIWNRHTSERGIATLESKVGMEF